MVELHSAMSKNVQHTSNSHEPSQIDENARLLIRDRCHLLLQIHDELLLEVDQNFLKDVGAIVRSCMEGVASLYVPLLVKLKVGPTWGSLRAYDER
eukprot:c22250_g1_i3 orf=235-522(+)